MTQTPISPEIAANKAEVALLDLAAQRKKEYDARPDRKIRCLEERISHLKRLKVDVWDSIRSNIKDVDSHGEIHVRSVPGVATDYSLNAIVRSNSESRRERVDAIDEAIETLNTFIGALKPTGSGQAPEDLEAFCADLLAKLPDRNEDVIVYMKEEGSAAQKAT